MTNMDGDCTNFHDNIAKLCLKHFKSLPRTGKPTKNEWTVLSCIVSQHESCYELVALGTGTKCIGSDKMSERGDILNDSHAEVMCRRAFLRYLYENMMTTSEGKNSIFVFDKEEKKFSLNQGVKFHFFTTEIPCGDAVISPKVKRDSSCQEEITRKKRKLEEDTPNSVNRTGAKCLKLDEEQDLSQPLGGGYQILGVVRTKPGCGVPTLSVSCSDKFARWCHIGIQGALLSILMVKPIYLSSLTITKGVSFNKEAIERALYYRLGNVTFDEHLSSLYQRRTLSVGQANFDFEYQKAENKTPSPNSIVWFKSKNFVRHLEVAVDGKRQGITKKQRGTKAARLKICKVELFQSFLEIIKTFHIKLPDVNEELNSLKYKDAKAVAKSYQEAWSSLKKVFGNWTDKDDRLLEFNVTL